MQIASSLSQVLSSSVTLPWQTSADVAAVSASTSATDSDTAQDDDPARQEQLKRLKDEQAALERLKALPNARQQAAQIAVQQVNWLILRLEALKHALMIATPAQAKALASQLKQIANALAEAGSLIGSAGGGDGSDLAATSIDLQASSATDEAVAETAVSNTASASANASAETTEQASDTGTEADTYAVLSYAAAVAQQTQNGLQQTASGASSQEGNASVQVISEAQPEDADQQLRDVLARARRALDEVLALRKAKLAHASRGDSQSRDSSQAGTA